MELNDFLDSDALDAYKKHIKNSRWVYVSFLRNLIFSFPFVNFLSKSSQSLPDSDTQSLVEIVKIY